MATFTLTVEGVPYTSTSLNVVLLEGTKRPLFPGLRSRVEKIPGRPGAYDFGADVDSLEFVLQCVFTEAAAFTSSAGFRAAAVALLALLINSATGRPAEVELSFSDVASKSWTVTLDGEVSPEMLTANYGQFELVFVAHDPFAHEVEDSTSGVVTTSPGTLNVTNSGSVPTPAVYIIKNEGVATIHGFTLKRVKET